MSLLIAADFRIDSFDEACVNRFLTAEEAGTSDLDETIARMTQRLQDLTHDEYESTTQTFELDVWVTSADLMLPKRCTAVSTVKTRDALGVLTTQPSTAYRLRSSLNAAGSATREPDAAFDLLELIPYGPGLSNAFYGPWEWPYGPQTVQVVGSFGWIVAPFDIKRALAHLVWDHYKGQRGDMGRVAQLSGSGIVEQFVPDDPAMTGIREVDAIIRDYARNVRLGVG